MMNYYASDYQRTTNSLARKMISVADEIVTLYMSGSRSNRSESLKRTKEYLAYFEQYVTGKHDSNKSFSFLTPVVKQELAKKLSIDIEPIGIEIELAVNRVRNMVFGEHIDEYGYDHNARFVDWTLRILGLIEKTAFDASNREYLSSSDRIFTQAEEKHHKGRKMLFYRNAYRAEMYSHKLYTDLSSEGTYDMYTPLILTRMAVEQYLKYMYEKKISSKAPSKPSECREALEKKGIISKALSNEVWAVLRRGNANTHEGYASYVFANMHCIAVLKMCLKELQTH